MNVENYTLCVVIPCYNVSKHIEKVVNGLPSEIDYIITVNDCSTDETLSILENLSATNQKIHVINHSLNQGVGGAMISGYKNHWN